MSVASPLLTSFSCAFSSILCCETNIVYLGTKEKTLGTNAAGQCVDSESKSTALATIMLGGEGAFKIAKAFRASYQPIVKWVQAMQMVNLYGC